MVEEAGLCWHRLAGHYMTHHSAYTWVHCALGAAEQSSMQRVHWCALAARFPKKNGLVSCSVQADEEVASPESSTTSMSTVSCSSRARASLTEPPWHPFGNRSLGAAITCACSRALGRGNLRWRIAGLTFHHGRRQALKGLESTIVRRDRVVSKSAAGREHIRCRSCPPPCQWPTLPAAKLGTVWDRMSLRSSRSTQAVCDA